MKDTNYHSLNKTKETFRIALYLHQQNMYLRIFPR